MDDLKPKRTKLKPIVYNANYFKRGNQNTSQQMFLLKALQVTQDPKKLRDMIGVKTVAEVYRTLDKLALRKDYHKSLSENGISFDYIVRGIKDIADAGEKDGDRLKAFQTLLKSVGMDTYKESESGSSGTWEEELLKSIESQKNSVALGEGEETSKVTEYEVIRPEIPESARLMDEEQDNLTSSLYDS